ncbi:MAG: hypothetical protein OXN44_08490 [Acidimicrobiaceae bacterium]|nr:hypothetical protein [Acidimicrobiaceae bacterium]MDE0607902.1 hypothetical protein [Acidimicrobiaceae bacterium]
MDRLLLVLGGVAIAGTVAALLSRIRNAAPAGNTRTIPRQLNRRDFDGATRPWLVAVFTASTCDTCAGVMERAKHLASGQVSVQELEHRSEAALHERYGVDSVPMVLIADETGAVQRAFLGPVTATDLWASLAELREPGTVSKDCNLGETTFSAE